MDPDGSPRVSDRATVTLYQDSKCQRSQRSLCMLTRGFVKLLEESGDGTLDLKDVSDVTPVNHSIQGILIATVMCNITAVI